MSLEFAEAGAAHGRAGLPLGLAEGGGSAGLAGFKRNVGVAMGNWLAAVDEPPESAVAVLRKALEDESELVREHAAWALGQGSKA